MFSFKRWCLVGGLVLASTAPALAIPGFCVDRSDGLRVEFGFHYGDYDEDDELAFDLHQLRRRGVDATRVEKWSGCLRAFVRQPNGHEIMELYDPNTYERVE
jgi:hypothetical protein